MVYGRKDLLAQVAQEWDKSTKKAGRTDSFKIDFPDVFDALNRYITSVVCKDKKAIKIPLFGTFAVSNEGHFDFYFQEKFIREFNLNTVGLPVLHKNIVAEEFNWHKCALKHSQKSTKDQITLGVKRVVSQLGWAIANQGATPVVIDFEVGRLEIVDGKPSFMPTPEACRAMGAKGRKAACAVDYKPSNTFQPVSDAVAQSLRVDSTVGQSVTSATGNPNYEPLLNDSQNQVLANSGAANAERAMNLAMQNRRGSMSSRSSVSSSGYSSSALSGAGKNGLSKQEATLKEAMSRYLDCMEQRASAAIRDRELWEDHVRSCILQEKEESDNRYKMEKQNQDFIQRQMRDNVVRGKEQRHEDIVAASAHEFPIFSEAIDHELQRQIKEQQETMRSELAEMISHKKAYDDKVAATEMKLALNQARSNKKKFQDDKRQEAEDERAQRAMLKEAWGIQNRCSKIQTTIDGFDMKQVESMNTARSSRGSARKRPVGAANMRRK